MLKIILFDQNWSRAFRWGSQRSFSVVAAIACAFWLLLLLHPWPSLPSAYWVTEANHMWRVWKMALWCFICSLWLFLQWPACLSFCFDQLHFKLKWFRYIWQFLLLPKHYQVYINDPASPAYHVQERIKLLKKSGCYMWHASFSGYCGVMQMLKHWQIWIRKMLLKLCLFYKFLRIQFLQFSSEVSCSELSFIQVSKVLIYTFQMEVGICTKWDVLFQTAAVLEKDRAASTSIAQVPSSVLKIIIF